MTLDRIDNENPMYGPGLVRWATAKTQNNNRSCNLTFVHSGTGEVFDTETLARLRKVRPTTIRKCRERGWSDDEIIEGRPRSAPLIADGYVPTGNDSSPHATADQHLAVATLWRTHLIAKRGYHHSLKLTGAERGQLKSFTDRCPPGEAAFVLQYALANWIEFTAHVKSAAGLYSTPYEPEIGFLLKYVNLAVRCDMEARKRELRVREANKTLPKPVPAPEPIELEAPNPPQPEEHLQPATLEELIAILREA